MPVAAVALMAVGTAVSAYGAYSQGQAQKKMNKYQADVANQQAVLAERTADQNTQLTQIQASQESKQLNRKYAVLAGEQKAARAASGLGGGSVSEGDIATDTLNTQNLDESMIRYNADLQSWKLKQNADMESWGLGNQATMYKTAGKQAAKAGMINAGSTILQGAASTAYTGYKLGVF